MIIDKKLLEIFNKFVSMDKEMILNKTNFMPMCAIVREGYKVEICMMPFGDARVKEATKQVLKKVILKEKTFGYFTGMDTKMTIIDKNNPQKFLVKDALVHSLFTPKENLSKICVYEEKDGKRVFTEEFEQENITSDWNVWNNAEIEDELNDVYQKIKKQNPKKYKGVI